MIQRISLFFCFSLALVLGLRAQVHSSGTPSTVPAASTEKGIQFFHGTWDELKAKAASEKKLIFVDAFTTWCGPCKMMAAKAFPDSAVGAFFNAKFVNYKFDMEKGEGPTFASNYGISAYPTVFILKADGTVVEKRVGAMVDPKVFLGWAQGVADPLKNPVAMKAEYESGSTNADLLYAYMTRQVAAGEDFSDAKTRYFSTQKDLATPQNWKSIQATVSDINDPIFKAMLKSKATFVSKFGNEAVEGYIATVCKESTSNAIEKGDNAAAASAMKIAKKNIADKGKTAALLQLIQVESQANWNNYATKTSAYTTKFKENNPIELNNFAWNFYQHVQDKAQLSAALNWAKQAVAIDNSYANNLTLGALQNKLGNTAEAKKTLTGAVRIAESNKQNTDRAKELLKGL